MFLNDQLEQNPLIHWEDDALKGPRQTSIPTRSLCMTCWKIRPALLSFSPPSMKTNDRGVQVLFSNFPSSVHLVSGLQNEAPGTAVPDV